MEVSVIYLYGCTYSADISFGNNQVHAPYLCECHYKFGAQFERASIIWVRRRRHTDVARALDSADNVALYLRPAHHHYFGIIRRLPTIHVRYMRKPNRGFTKSPE